MRITNEDTQLYYYIYKTTNEINGMIYIGVHRTIDLKDGYIGSGTLLRRAIKKYSKENFSKTILKMCESADDMFSMESELVNKSFVSSKKTYNIKLGGRSGPIDPKKTDYYKSGEHKVNTLKARAKATIKQQENKQLRILNYFKNPNLCKQCSEPLDYDKKRNKFCNSSCSATFNNTGRVLSEEHKRKISNTVKRKQTNNASIVEGIH